MAARSHRAEFLPHYLSTAAAAGLTGIWTEEEDFTQLGFRIKKKSAAWPIFENNLINTACTWAIYHVHARCPNEQSLLVVFKTL